MSATDDVLKDFVERIVALMGERDSINEDLSQIYKDSKEAGFVTKHLRRIVAEYRMEDEDRRSQYETLDQYRAALGLLAGTPLGDAAMSRVTGSKGRGGKKPADRDGEPAVH